MRRLLPLIVLAILLPTRAGAVASGDAGRTQELQKLEAQERTIRGLSQLHPVRAKFLPNKAFDALIVSQTKRDEPPREIALGQRENEVVGFLQPGQSLKKILFAGITAQVAGVYDDHTKTLYVRGQDSEVFRLERRVVVHEYTHALQDQHWNLTRILPNENNVRYRNSDALGARHAFVEGDATTTETIFIEKAYTAQQYRDMVTYERNLPAGPPLPWAIQKEFYFPYTTGLQFAATLYRLGGMRQINATYSRLPASTYEVMFPDAYLKHWKPSEVSLHSVQGFPGWKQVDDDVFGALLYKLLLWQHGTEKAATSTVRGYKGDRYLFLEKGSKNLLLMRSRWSSSAAAQRARRALAQSLLRRFGQNYGWKFAHTVIATPGLSVYVNAVGDTVTLAYAPTAALARTLGTAGTQ